MSSRFCSLKEGSMAAAGILQPYMSSRLMSSRALQSSVKAARPVQETLHLPAGTRAVWPCSLQVEGTKVGSIDGGM